MNWNKYCVPFQWYVFFFLFEEKLNLKFIFLHILRVFCVQVCQRVEKNWFINLIFPLSDERFHFLEKHSKLKPYLSTCSSFSRLILWFTKSVCIYMTWLWLDFCKCLYINTWELPFSVLILLIISWVAFRISYWQSHHKMSARWLLPKFQHCVVLR